MRPLLTSSFIFFVAALFVTACGPGENEQTKSPGIQVYEEESEIHLTINPNYPDDIVTMDAQIVVGIVNAPVEPISTAISLQHFELQNDGKTTALGGELSESSRQIDSQSITHRLYVNGITAKNSELISLCDAKDSTIHVGVVSVIGKASAEIPVTLLCLEDRNAGELNTRALGTAPADMPCGSTGPEPKLKLGYDTQGNLEIVDDVPNNPEDVTTSRTVYERDGQGRVVTKTEIYNGLLSTMTTYTYENDRVVSIVTQDLDPSATDAGEAKTSQVTWTSDDKAELKNTVLTRSPDGLTITTTPTQGTGLVTMTFEKPISLTELLTRNEYEVHHLYKIQSHSQKFGTQNGHQEFKYEDGRLIEEATYINDSLISRFSWLYTCE